MRQYNEMQSILVANAAVLFVCTSVYYWTQEPHSCRNDVIVHGSHETPTAVCIQVLDITSVDLITSFSHLLKVN